MNLEQYLALHVRSTEVKVAHASYKEQQRAFESMMEDLYELRQQPITADQLREALLGLHRLHTAHVDTLTAILFHDRP